MATGRVLKNSSTETGWVRSMSSAVTEAIGLLEVRPGVRMRVPVTTTSESSSAESASYANAGAPPTRIAAVATLMASARRIATPVGVSVDIPFS